MTTNLESRKLTPQEQISWDFLRAHFKDWEWFIQPFPEILSFIKEKIADEESNKISSQEFYAIRAKLSDVWFRLPDNRFNVRENPPGWGSFIWFLDDV